MVWSLWTTLLEIHSFGDMFSCSITSGSGRTAEIEGIHTVPTSISTIFSFFQE